MSNNYNRKLISDTYIFKLYSDEYEKSVLDFVKGGTEIDVHSAEFEDLAYDIKKRQVGRFLVDVLNSKNVKLYISNKPLNRSMRVITAKDIKAGNGKHCVYIDCTQIIEKKNGKYKCNDIEKLIAHLLDASVNLMYYSGVPGIVTNTTSIKSGAYSFASLFNNVINYLFKTNSISNIHNRCLYLASLYYIRNIVGGGVERYAYAENTALAKQIARISDREAEMLDMYIEKSSFTNIDNFVKTLSQVLKLSDLNTTAVISTWIKLYTPSTLFALEYYPAFSAMMTNAYIGCYLNNQSTIEKITNRGLPEYVKSILDIGGQASWR